jgi:hypothetical protein
MRQCRHPLFDNTAGGMRASGVEFANSADGLGYRASASEDDIIS